MTVLIIEDEERAYKNLKHILLEIDPSINIVSWLQSVEQSIEWFNSNTSPDLIFLDIHLSDDLSFKIFESVQVSCPIIFTTAFDEFAIKAFELNSIDYVLKPITQKNIETSLAKFNTRIKSNSNPYDKLIEDLKNISNTPNYKERFLVNKGDELVIILTTDISYFYKDNDTYIVLENGNRYPIKFTLEQLIELLNPVKFYRINRQIIVSINAISKITLWFKGKLKLQLTPKFNDDVFVSREKSAHFKSWMDR
ncbi:LytR/AlgR family response regulator transcription factor [Winogradskyella psychrotolerans]|uniref:LytR/AlgR family response regulator transcription factor n=1 Tax=Winogradskyella psychrotolerans TaxID=1344585 RepID=UPI001C0708B5|nr:LytTR family DNA-binding domain-containing protein [Winogradskyella psychrotolerans]MBU2928764.1 LytTR family DNA-binding domain-containing protein [Winogradskyella psychrotolerans]